MINVIIPPILVSQQPLGTSTFDQINDVITSHGSSKRSLPFPVCSEWGGKGMLSAGWLVLLLSPLSTYQSHGTPSSSPPAKQLNHIMMCNSSRSPVPHRDIWRCLISAALNSMANSQRSCPSWAWSVHPCGPLQGYLPPLTCPQGHRVETTEHKSPEEIYLMTRPLCLALDSGGEGI